MPEPREELLVVLGTSSSEPVLPRLLMKLERLGCKKGIVNLVLPTGHSFNLDGTAIYLTLASLFIAQACDIHLTGGRSPRARLDAAHLEGRCRRHGQRLRRARRHAGRDARPARGRRGPAVGIDRFVSEARALTSTMSNAVACVVVSIWEQACDRDVLARELSSGYVHTEQAREEEASFSPALVPPQQAVSMR